MGFKGSSETTIPASNYPLDFADDSTLRFTATASILSSVTETVLDRVMSSRTIGFLAYSWLLVCSILSSFVVRVFNTLLQTYFALLCVFFRVLAFVVGRSFIAFELYQLRNMFLASLLKTLRYIVPITFIRNIFAKLNVSSSILDSYTLLSPANKQADVTTISQFFHVYRCGMTSEPLSFSFPSNHWLVFYQLGAAQCLQDSINSRYIKKEAIFTGSGTGAIVSALLALEYSDFRGFSKKLYDVLLCCSKQPLGPISNLSRTLRALLSSELQKLDIAAIMVQLNSKRLEIELLTPPKITTKTSFESKQDLIDSIMASIYFPLIFEEPVRIFKSIEEIEKGGLNSPFKVFAMNSNTVPITNSRTIVISAHAGANICPSAPKYDILDELFLSPTIGTCYSQPDDDVTCSTSRDEEMFDCGYEETSRWLRQMRRDGVLPSAIFGLE